MSCSPCFVVGRFGRRCWLLLAVSSFMAGNSLCAAESPAEKNNAAPAGVNMASAGHSFHMFMPTMLRDLVKTAGIEQHQQVATQGIGGSYVHQHWNRPDEQNQIKAALREGKVDVLTLSPIYLPDDGIENFVRLGLEHNPKLRVTLQEFWLPYDVYNVDYKKRRPDPVDRNARTSAQLHEQHDPYFKSMDDHIAALNKQFGKQVLYAVPAGQATVLLREKIIAGEAPGLKEQNDLFNDAIGHPTTPLRLLNTYCHYAVIYGRSPVGLPVPASLNAMPYREHAEALNTLLQELAWQAVREHPHTGVK